MLSLLHNTIHNNGVRENLSCTYNFEKWCENLSEGYYYWRERCVWWI